MAKASLKSIHNLINMAVKETPVNERFLQDLKASIERMDADNSRKPSQTYKPSSMNCIRNMYYQVVGAEQDPGRSEYCLIGICESGSDRHERIQNAVSHMKDYGVDCEYIDVADYITRNNLDRLEVVGKQGFETKLYHKDLNISFLCDGIVRYQGKYYILEIKTESVYKWQSRTDVAEEHHNQATCYSMCFGINDVLFVYENRDNCDKKCYVFTVTDDMRMGVVTKIEECDLYVKQGTPPPKPVDVPKKACTYCSYKTECRKAGS